MRLLNQIQDETASFTKNDETLMDDSRIDGDDCSEQNCEANLQTEAAKPPLRSGTRSNARSGVRSMASNLQISGQQSNLSEEQEYSSDEDAEDSDDDFRKIISAHDELLLLDRDSVVNFGTNVQHELRKQK
jgi:hypothetical protein